MRIRSLCAAVALIAVSLMVSAGVASAQDRIHAMQSGSCPGSQNSAGAPCGAAPFRPGEADRDQKAKHEADSWF
jgi:hypothetical protein